MTLTQLEYLIAVDVFGSFAKAASRCYVTQPTLSMQVKKLEEELNVLIFDRSKKPIITTDLGKAIIEQARIILQEKERLYEIIQEEKNDLKGELHVGIIPTLSPYLLPLFVTEFIKKHPDINLVVEELLTSEIIAKLRDERLDIGILVTPLNEKKILEIPLFYEKFYIYLSSRHPLFFKDQISIEDLDFREMWLLQEGHCFRSQTLNICGDKRSLANPQLKFESGNLETLRRIVNQQSGYTFLPELAATDLKSPDLNNLRRFPKPEPTREVSLVTHQSFVKKRLINLFADAIKSSVPKTLLNKDRGRLIKI